MGLAFETTSEGRPYRSVADTVRREINGGRFLESPALPGERALREVLAVSRTTLRKAVTQLISEGPLFRRKKRSPALFIQRVGYMADGRCVELTRSLHRADACDSISELTICTQRRAH